MTVKSYKRDGKTVIDATEQLRLIVTKRDADGAQAAT